MIPDLLVGGKSSAGRQRLPGARQPLVLLRAFFALASELT